MPEGSIIPPHSCSLRANQYIKRKYLYRNLFHSKAIIHVKILMAIKKEKLKSNCGEKNYAPL